LKKRILSVVLVLGLVFSVVGCSTGTSGSGNEAKEETVKVAVMAPLTGNLANIGEQFKQGVELKAKQVNEAGGVNGKKGRDRVFRR
jgi:branched-chain amino acid transport system substrate-binding protein